jgi:hypothetical protein
MKSSCSGGESRGIDSGKTKGQKQHIITDTLRLIAVVHTVDIHSCKDTMEISNLNFVGMLYEIKKEFTS